MTRQANRNWRVQIADRSYTGIDITFEIEKAVTHNPNKGTISLFNLSAESRRQIDELSATRRRGPSRIRVKLEVAYADNPLQTIFIADLRTGKSEETPPGTWVTKIEGEDSGRAFLWSRVNQSFTPGTGLLAPCMACVEAMGVGIGNLREAVAEATLEGGGTVFSAGTVVSGPAPEELAGLLHSMGLTYSVQDNVLQVLRRGHAIQRTAVRLAYNTGLVGRPSKELDGVVKFTSLLNPDIYPGRQIRVESRDLTGTYRAKKVKYQGETAGIPWYCHVEAEELIARA